jgi:hypothetical protein
MWLELEADEGFAANDLRVVARLDHVSLAGTDLELGSIFVRNSHPA